MKCLYRILSVGIAMLVVWLLLHAPPLVPNIDATKPVAIALPQQLLLRQSSYACGPYTTAAALSTVGMKTDPAELTKTMQLFFEDRGTLPWGIRLTAWNAGAGTRSLWLGRLTDDERLKVLYQQLQKGNPVIALVHLYNYPHYILLLGYNPSSQTFDVYDPLNGGSVGGLTTDSNGAATGNRQFSMEELFAVWEQGSVYGLYKWYGISIKGN